MSDVELWRELGQQLRVDGIRPAAKAGSGHPEPGDQLVLAGGSSVVGGEGDAHL